MICVTRVLSVFVGLAVIVAALQTVALSREQRAMTPADPASDIYIERENVNYRKINTAAVFFLLREGNVQFLSEALVLRGVARRTAELDGQGGFLMLRVNMVCCSSDAMAAGLIVTHPRFKEIRDGQWVRVFGRLSTLREARKLLDLPKIEEVPYYSMVDRAIFIADTVETIDRPDSVYLYQLPRTEEFDY